MSNSAGSDSAKGEIKVLDRPEPPEGLTASVDGDKCVLMWKRSKDDGGAPIEHYQVPLSTNYFRKNLPFFETLADQVGRPLCFDVYNEI